jgi:hypothetical protein
MKITSTFGIAAMTIFCFSAVPVMALTCEDMAMSEATAYTKSLPKEKWFKPDSASPEDNARAWLKSPKGQAQVAKDRQRSRKGCV